MHVRFRCLIRLLGDSVRERPHGNFGEVQSFARRGTEYCYPVRRTPNVRGGERIAEYGMQKQHGLGLSREYDCANWLPWRNVVQQILSCSKKSMWPLNSSVDALGPENARVAGGRRAVQGH